MVFAFFLLVICGLGLVCMLLQFGLAVATTLYQWWVLLQAARADLADRKSRKFERSLR